MRRGILTVLVIGVAVMIGAALLTSGPSVPDESVLVLELGGTLEEQPPLDPLQQLFARGPSLPQLLLQLDKAQADPRITALLLRIRPLDLGYARIQELRDALGRVRRAGKQVISVLDIANLNATRELYLASAGERIYAVPGYLGPFAGIAGQYLYLGGLFDKLGIQMEYERVGAYKSTPEMFASRGMSEPARRMLNELMDGLFAQITSGIAAGRGLEVARVRELIEAAPATAQELLEAGLIDGIAGTTEEALRLAGLGKRAEVAWDEYLHVDPRELGLRDGPAIALIFADGMLTHGQPGRGPGSGSFASDRIGAALEEARENERVRAVVLRINSGGGSALAADQLWQVVRRVRAKKPIVISMADAAASGGYYVASAATAILAEPATMTGSIGVFFMRPALAGLYRKLDIGAELLARGQHASVAAGDAPLTPEQRERTTAFVRSLYENFLDRVASGREMSRDAVDRLGQGRVWLGESAYARGLIDGLGGLHAAVLRAAEAAGLDPEVDPERLVLPGPRGIAEQMSDLLRGEWLNPLGAKLLPGRFAEVLGGARLALEGRVAYLPPHWIEIH